MTHAFRILASAEVLSTDDEIGEDSGASDIEEMAKNIESLLTNKKTSSQVISDYLLIKLWPRWSFSPST